MLFNRQILWKPILTSVLILVACLMPKSMEPQPTWFNTIPYFDKIVHLALYAILGISFFWNKQPYERLKMTLFVLLYASLLGLSIEFIQPLVNRSCEMTDFVADLLGTVLGIVVSVIFLNKQQNPDC